MPDEQGYSTQEEIYRERAAAAKHRRNKDVVIEGSHLPESEQRRLRAMDPEDRLQEWWFRTHPMGGSVETTGAELWQGGRSPHPDELQRMSGGRYRFALNSEGQIVPDTFEDRDGNRLSGDQVKARVTLELAGL